MKVTFLTNKLKIKNSVVDIFVIVKIKIECLEFNKM